MARLAIPDALLDIDSNAVALTSLDVASMLRDRYLGTLPLRSVPAVEFMIDASHMPNWYASLKTVRTVAVNLGLLLWAVQVASNLRHETRS